MEIKRMEAYDEAAVLALYDSVGWTAYTDTPDALKRVLKTRCWLWVPMKMESCWG